MISDSYSGWRHPRPPDRRAHPRRQCDRGDRGRLRRAPRRVLASRYEYTDATPVGMGFVDPPLALVARAPASRSV